MFPRLARRAAHATVVALLAGGALAACTPPAPPPSTAPAASTLSAEEARFVEWINYERARAGLAPLTVNDGAVGVARNWATQMAQSGTLRHNPNLASDVSSQVTASWVRIAENVGAGADPDSVHQALMASGSHRANVLDGAYDIVGVGVVRSGSTLWMSTVFVAV